MRNLYPNTGPDQVVQDSNLSLKGKPKIIKSKMHIASSIIYSIKSMDINEIIDNKNIYNLVGLLRTISTLIADRIANNINSEE